MPKPLLAFKLPLYFDAGPLKSDLSVLQGVEWADHFNPLHYQGGWNAVALKSSGGRTGALRIGKQPYQDTPIVERTPNIAAAIRAFNCDTGRVRLMRLEAGAVIKKHIDPNLGFPFGKTIRLHIPIDTNDQVEFVVGGQHFKLNEGECWYLNTTYPHHVQNNGPTDRVHLVIDCIPNDWLKNLFPAIYLKRSWARYFAYNVRHFRYVTGYRTKMLFTDPQYFAIRLIDKLFGRARTERPAKEA